MHLRIVSARSFAIAHIVLALLSLVIPFCASAQDGRAPFRIGLVTPYQIPPAAVEQERAAYKTFEQTLRALGYVLGKDLDVFYRTTDGRDELLPARIAELLALKVNVLLTVGTPATRAAQTATSTTPIVMVTVLDPVHAGFVTSLRHPGGNITGSSELSEELVPKRLELVKEAIPKAALVAVLWDPTHPTNVLDLKRTEDAARALGLRPIAYSAHDRNEIDKAFLDMQRARPDALIVLTSYSAFVHIRRIVELAKKNRLPTVYGTLEGARQGALLSYGPSISDQYRHAANFVDRILKGAKPGDLPVEQPTKFELAVNSSTARTLGIAIPESILMRADEVVK